MGITVREALELEEIKGMQLLAGRQGLERVINHVSVLEIASNFNQWLQGHELILTTLFAFRGNVEQMISLVKEFASAEVAALGIHPGVEGNPLAPEMIEKADQLGLPLLLLPGNMPYTTVISTVSSAILNRQEFLLRRSSQMNRSMVQVILEEGDISQIAATLSGLIRSPVAITDEKLQLLAFHGNDNWGHDFYENLAQSPGYKQWIESFKAKMLPERLAKAKEPFRIAIYFDGRILNQLVMPVSAGNRIEGFIFAWETNSPFSDIEKIAITHGVTAVALDLLKKKAVEETERRFSNEFIEDLLEGNFSSEKAIFRRADSLGIGISFFRVVITADIDDFEKYLLGQGRKERDIQNLKTCFYQTVCNAVEKHIPGNLVVSKSDSIIILPRLAAGTGDDDIYIIIHRMVESVSRSVQENLPEITVSIGIGSISATPAGLRQSYLEACQALEIGRRVYGNGHISFFRDQGIYRLLWAAINEPWFLTFCQSQLSELLEYDKQNNARLIQTMEAYLDADESLVKASKVLYLHPNTIRYRVERVKEILNRDPFTDPGDKLSFHLAVKGWKLIDK